MPSSPLDEQPYMPPNDTAKRWRRAIAALILTGAFLFLVIMFVATWTAAIGEHPTPDQRYGCTAAQQKPNGECP